MIYRIEIARRARNALLAIPKSDSKRIEQSIDQLAEHPRPRGVKKLVGGGGELRIRVGEYRVIYIVDDGVLLVLVLEIGPRKEIYRRRGPRT